MEKVFHVHFHHYQHPSGGPDIFYAPDAEPSIDTAVPIPQVCGLDDFTTCLVLCPLHRTDSSKKKTAVNSYAGSGLSGCYLGNDFRAAYLPGVTLTGSGQNIGLFELDGYYTVMILLHYAQLARLTNVTSISNVHGGRLRRNPRSKQRKSGLVEHRSSDGPGPWSWHYCL